MSDVQHQKPDPIESNARLFGHYTAKFSNLNQFVPFAKKFSDWLNDHRAYYELARPEIVKILEHAKKTLQNSDVHLHESPYFSAYQSMVIAAWTHRARFIESELCERLEALHSGLNFVNANQAHSPSPISVIASQPEPAPQTATTSPPPIATPIVQLTSPHASMGEESAKRRATTGPTKPRKRKKIDYSKYTQIDMAGVGVSDSQPPVAQEQTSLEPMDGLSSTVEQVQSANEAEDIRVGTTPTVGDLFSSPSLRGQPLKRNPTLPAASGGLVRSDHALDSIQVPIVKDVPEHELSPNQHHALAASDAQQKSELPTRDVEMADQDLLDNHQSDPPPQTHHDEDQVQEKAVDNTGTQELEPAPMSIETQAQARDVVPPPEPVPREPIKLDISDRLKKAESIRLDICNLMSQSKQKVNPEDINVPSIEGFTHQLRVLSYTEGASTDAKHHFTVRVSSAQLATIKAWNNRHEDPIAAEHNKQNCCISLVCYRKQDLVEDKIKQHSAFEYQLFNDLKPSWPKDNRLLLDFIVNGQTKCFPMAPPLLTTPEGFFELGPYLREGENTFNLVVQGDMSSYVFCLVSHYPTRRQKEQMQKRLSKDRSWSVALDALVRPLEISPSLFQSAV